MIGRLALRARVLAFAAAVPLLMRLPLPTLARILDPRRPPTPGAAANEREVGAEVELVLTRAGRLIRPSCLTRGLTRYYFLRRAGVPLTLCFGVGRLDAEVAGHCWLLRDGEPFLEARDPRLLFTETYRIPVAAAR